MNSAAGRTTAIGLLLVACSASPPTNPSYAQDLERARHAEREAVKERDDAQAVVAGRNAALSDNDRQMQALRDEDSAAKKVVADQARELRRFEQSIGEVELLEKDCSKGELRLQSLEHMEYFSRFRSGERRDHALKALDVCRKALLTARRKELGAGVVSLRNAYAIEIEDLFDEANPYSRGTLTATVKGTTLSVRMRGNFEGRRRHSQEEVDLWCSEYGVFSKISLRNSHGTFSCKPSLTAKESIERILATENLLSPWTKLPPGSTPEPQASGTVDETESDQRRAELLGERAQLDVDSKTETSVAMAAAARAKTAKQTRLELEVAEDQRIEEWQRKARKSARGQQIAGVAVGGAGVVPIVLGVLMDSKIEATESALSTAQVNLTEREIGDLEEKLDEQKTTRIIEISVGASMLGVGVGLYFLGKLRSQKLKNVALGPNGVAVHF